MTFFYAHIYSYIVLEFFEIYSVETLKKRTRQHNNHSL